MTTPDTALGALIVLSLALVGLVGWLLKFIFSNTLPEKDKDVVAQREVFEREMQAMRTLYERRQDALLSHCEAQTTKEREASERRVREALTELRATSSEELEQLRKINESVRETTHLTRNVLASIQTRTRLSDIVLGADDAIYSKSLDGVVTSWNPACERLFGWKSPEIIGQYVQRIVPPERQAEEEETLRKARAGEASDHFETERLRKDGRRVRVSVAVSPIRDPSGRVIGASTIAREVS